jgi:hypothetical protein
VCYLSFAFRKKKSLLLLPVSVSLSSFCSSGLWMSVPVWMPENGCFMCKGSKAFLWLALWTQLPVTGLGSSIYSSLTSVFISVLRRLLAAFPGKPTGHSLNQVCPGPMESPGPSSRPHRKVVESGYILLRKQWTVKKESNRTEWLYVPSCVISDKLFDVFSVSSSERWEEQNCYLSRVAVKNKHNNAYSHILGTEG